MTYVLILFSVYGPSGFNTYPTAESCLQAQKVFEDAGTPKYNFVDQIGVVCWARKK